MSSYAERLYEQFQKEKESFNRWLFFALLVVIFNVFVFQPYLSLLTNLAELKATQVGTDAKIKEAKQELENSAKAGGYAVALLDDEDKYKQLYRNARSWINSIDALEQRYDLQSRKVNALHDSVSQAERAGWAIGTQPSNTIIKSLQQSRPEMMQHYDSADNCFFKLEIDWVACQVEKNRKPITDYLSSLFNDRSLPQQYTALLNREISSNTQKYHSSLANALSQGNLKAWVKEYLDQEQAILKRWLEDMLIKANEQHRLASNLASIQKYYKQVAAELTKRKQEFNQMGEIDTPLGPVKLGLHDILASLPLAGLCILIMLVKSTIRQLAIRTAFQAKGPENETTPEALTLTMPIWLEPFKYRMLNFVLIGALAVIAIATMYGLWQVVTNPGLTVANVNFNNYFLIALTCLTAVVFVMLYTQLLRKFYILCRQVKTIQ